MKVKEESGKVGLKLNIQKTKIIASGPISSWKKDGETMETVRNFIFLGSKITADGNCSHEIKRCLLLGRNAMTKLEKVETHFANKGPYKQSNGFTMHRFKSWTIKKAEHWIIDAFEPWCWRRLLRVPRTAKRSNHLSLKEINPEYSLERLMLKLKLQYFGHLMQRTDSLEKTLMLRKIEGRKRRGWQRMICLDGITNSMNMSLSKLWE